MPKLCECGCGASLRLETSRFVMRSHGHRHVRPATCIAGKDCVIYLPRNQRAYCDAADYRLVCDGSWCVNTRGYVVRNKNGKHELLHRVITRCPVGFVVDHLDFNKRNNRRSNLRICRQSANVSRKRKHKTGTSTFKGVHVSANGRIYAEIQPAGRRLYLGRFVTLEDAARAYDAAAIEAYGDAAMTNGMMGLLPV